MEVVDIVKEAIGIAIKVAIVIHDAMGTRQELQELHADIRALESALKLCQGLVEGDAKLAEAVVTLAEDANAAVAALKKTIQPYEKAVGAKKLSIDRWKLLFKYLDQDDIKRYQERLRHYAVLINGVCGIKTSRTVTDIATTLKGVDASLNRLATPMQESEIRLFKKLVEDQDEKTEAIVTTLEKLCKRMADTPQTDRGHLTDFPARPEPRQAGYPRHTLDTFLASLDVATGHRNEYTRVRDAEPDTCRWILQQKRYTEWLSGPDSATFLLHGRMGCGKSVLTKHILHRIRDSETTVPPRESNKTAVVYHFCGGASLPTGPSAPETAADILESMVYHFLVRRPSLFSAIQEHTDVLDDYPPSRTGSASTSNRLSLQSLWTALTTLFAASRHSTIYCFIDAIDECEPKSAGELLQLYRQSCRDEFSTGTLVKFFISSRDGPTETSFIDTMRGIPRFGHLEVEPDFVGPDLQVVVERSLSGMKWLPWSSAQREQARTLLIEKAEGMFLWAQTAITLLEKSADGLPFVSALRLIDNMPRKMEGLYSHALEKLCKSLDEELEVVQTVREVLGWLLHVARPFSVAELSLALAIDPDKRTLANTPDRRVDACRFVQKYLSPFVVLVPPEGNTSCPDLESSDPYLAPIANPAMIVRTVHQTAQEFLQKVCSGDIDDARFAALRVGTSECHEGLARICLGYLCCEELQLGWINDDETNDVGQVGVDAKTKALVAARLSQNALLGYAAQHWPSHLVYCEDRGPGDAYGLALDFLLNHPKSLACAEQVRQYVKWPEWDWYWLILGPLHKAAQIDSSTLCRRILDGGLADINSLNSSGCTPLILACSHKVNEKLPGISVETGALLLEHGADPSLRDKFQRTAMHYAAANGQVGLLKLLLGGRGRTSVEVKDSEGETPIHDAVDFDQLEATEVLLAAGVDVDSTDQDGCTPLHCAARRGHTRVLRFLLEHGASPHARDKVDFTPLHHACVDSAAGKLDCARILLDYGCAKDARSKEGYTSLAFASQDSSKDMVQLLCGRGANVNSKTGHGVSPLALACERGDFDIVAVLLQNGAKPDVGSDTGSRPLHAGVVGHSLSIVQALIRKGVDINAKGNAGWTPLQVAVAEGQSSIASVLIASGAKVDIRKDDGATALHIAASKDNVGMIDILLAGGADVGVLTDAAETCLHWAVAGDAVQTTRRLLAQKMDPSQKNDIGQTPLHLSAENLEISSLLLGAGSDPRVQTTEGGYTPAHLAAMNGSKNVLELLLNNGADMEARGTNGPTPLHLAAQEGHQDCCDLLLSRGADREARDGWSQTPLWLAAGKGKTEAVELLLQHGADVKAQNVMGSTPLHEACRHGYLGVTRLLVSGGAKITHPDHSGITPLDRALAGERKDITMELLSSKEPFTIGSLTLGLLSHLNDPEALGLGIARLDDSTETPELVELWPVALAAAAREGKVNRVETFLDHGVDTASLFDEAGDKVLSFPVSDKTADVIDSLLRRGVLKPDRPDKDGWNILYWACFCESRRAVEVVLRHADSASVTAKTKTKRCALHGAAGNKESTAIVEALLQTPLGADIDCRDDDGWTPLHVAVSAGTLATTKLLLAHGANLSAATSQGESVLHLAFRNSDADVAMYLLGLKVDGGVNQPTNSGVTPLHMCSALGSGEALEALLSLGAELDPVDQDGEDALYFAVRRPNLETLRALLEQNIQLGRQNKHGWTALHHAAFSGPDWVGAAEVLLDSGASLMTDVNGWTPVDIAAECSPGPMLDLLLKRGGKALKPLEGHYPIPSRWNARDKSTGLVLSEGDCAVELSESASQPVFTTPTATDDDGAVRMASTVFESPGYSVRSDFCIPRDANEFYFECEILEDPRKNGCIAVGLASPTAALHKLAGCDLKSWGYHGDDGQVRNGNAPNKDYGPGFTSADVIGCVYRRADASVHFTKNGKYLGTAFNDVHGELYPMVSLIFPGSKVRCKFNLSPPSIVEVLQEQTSSVS